jgi:release factor glutamine methyltransferase
LRSIDISEDAINCTVKNFKKFKIPLGNQAVRTDFFKEEEIWKNIDAFICNPPYVKTKDVKTTFEPALALDGGDDGLIFYKRSFDIIKKHKNILTVVFEIGFDLKHDIEEILSNYNFKKVFFKKDIGNNDRVLIIQNS